MMILHVLVFDVGTLEIEIENSVELKFSETRLLYSTTEEKSLVPVLHLPPSKSVL